jgi:hypothetical protein
MMTFNDWLQSEHSTWLTSKQILAMVGVSPTTYQRLKLDMMWIDGTLDRRVVPIHIKGKFRYEYRPTGKATIS